MKVLNISNHVLTSEQIEELRSKDLDEIVELPANLKAGWAQCKPSTYIDLCEEIGEFMVNNGIKYAHLAGFPAAISYMVSHMNGEFIYAYSERESVEETQSDGSVIKRNVFKHKGFYYYM